MILERMDAASGNARGVVQGFLPAMGLFPASLCNIHSGHH